MSRRVGVPMALGPALLLALTSCAPDGSPTGPMTGSDQAVATESAADGRDTWTAKPPMPTGRHSLGVAVVSNALNQSVLYAIGGVGEGSQSLSTVEAFNLVTNSWTAKASLPANLGEANGAVVIAGKIYLSGGRDLDNHSPGSDDGTPRSSLYVYDPATDRWTRKADMPEGSISGVSGAIDGRLYVLNTLVNRFDRYDPATDTWSALARCPGRHFRGAAAVIAGRFYVAGGEWFSASGPYAIRKLHVYTPSTDRWSEEAPLPHAVAGAAGARLVGQFYVLGGDNTARGFDFVQVYDPVAKTWTLKAHMPTARGHFAASSFLNQNGKRRLVAIGGFGGLSADLNLRSNDVYKP